MSLAALFPGQGSQAVGMAHDLYERSAAARRVLDRAEDALPGLLTLMWSGPEEELQLTSNQQPALVAAGAAAYFAYLEAGGAPPACAAGHSLGEFTALVAAGALTLEDALRLVRRRGEYMQDAVPEGAGAMAAILKLGEDAIREALAAAPGVVEIANLNAPGQTVISGEAAAVAAAGDLLRERGARVVPLRVSAPFHCSLMGSAAARLGQDLAGVAFGRPAFDVVSNVTADVVTDPAAIPALLERQVTAPVRWVESLRRLERLGARRFLEFGSGRVLTNLVSRTVEGVQALAVTDYATLQEAL